MATKKAAKKAAAKPKAKALTTDEALRALKRWERHDYDDRGIRIDLAYSEFNVELIAAGRDFRHTAVSLSVAITKALAAAKKAGHA